MSTQTKEQTFYTAETGTFETPKKHNRSAATIPAATVEQLEAGEFTSEMLDALAGTFPVFKYKTCVTIHGLWPDIARQRIAGYKNIYQNGNGSLAVRYSAIDAGKRAEIARDLASLRTRYHYHKDSQGSEYQITKQVTRHTLEGERANLEAIAARIKAVPFWGRTEVILYRHPYFGLILQLEVEVKAIQAEQVTPLTLAMSGATLAELETARTERAAQIAQAKEQQEQEAASRAVRKEGAQKLATQLQIQIESLPQGDPTKHTLVKVGLTIDSARFFFARMVKRSAFGRVLFERAGSDTLPTTSEEFAALTWREDKKAIQTAELKGDYRKFTPPAAKAPAAATRPDATPTKAPEMKEAAPVASAQGVEVIREERAVWLKFDGKPDETTRERLKASGAKWNKFRVMWYLSPVTTDAQALAIATGTKEGSAPSAPAAPAPQTEQQAAAHFFGDRAREENALYEQMRANPSHNDKNELHPLFQALTKEHRERAATHQDQLAEGAAEQGDDTEAQARRKFAQLLRDDSKAFNSDYLMAITRRLAANPPHYHESANPLTLEYRRDAAQEWTYLKVLSTEEGQRVWNVWAREYGAGEGAVFNARTGYTVLQFVTIPPTPPSDPKPEPTKGDHAELVEGYTRGLKYNREQAAQARIIQEEETKRAQFLEEAAGQATDPKEGLDLSERAAHARQVAEGRASSAATYEERARQCERELQALAQPSNPNDDQGRARLVEQAEATARALDNAEETEGDPLKRARIRGINNRHSYRQARRGRAMWTEPREVYKEAWQRLAATARDRRQNDEARATTRAQKSAARAIAQPLATEKEALKTQFRELRAILEQARQATPNARIFANAEDATSARAVFIADTLAPLTQRINEATEAAKTAGRPATAAQPQALNLFAFDTATEPEEKPTIPSASAPTIPEASANDAEPEPEGDPLASLLTLTFMSDIPLELARAAHSGTSWFPEKRGDSEQAGHAAQLREDLQMLLSHATTPETRAILAQEFPRYREGYTKRNIAYLGSRSRLVSSMIAGPANFPVRRMQKRGDVAHNRLGELIAFREKALGAIIRKLHPERAAIRTEDADAADKLRAKIAKAKNDQERMKTANACIRKHAKEGEEAQILGLVSLGFSESIARELLKPDFCRRIGFPDFALTNNLANIKRMEDRVKKIEAFQSREDSCQECEHATLTICWSENRVRLEFPGKPDDEARAKLKRRGFKWSRTLGVWQNYINSTSLDFAREMAGPPIEGPEDDDPTPPEPEEETEKPSEKEDAPTLAQQAYTLRAALGSAKVCATGTRAHRLNRAFLLATYREQRRQSDPAHARNHFQAMATYRKSAPKIARLQEKHLQQAIKTRQNIEAAAKTEKDDARRARLFRAQSLANFRVSRRLGQVDFYRSREFRDARPKFPEIEEEEAQSLAQAQPEAQSLATTAEQEEAAREEVSKSARERLADEAHELATKLEELEGTNARYKGAAERARLRVHRRGSRSEDTRAFYKERIKTHRQNDGGRREHRPGRKSNVILWQVVTPETEKEAQAGGRKELVFEWRPDRKQDLSSTFTGQTRDKSADRVEVRTQGDTITTSINGHTYRPFVSKKWTEREAKRQKRAALFGDHNLTFEGQDEPKTKRQRQARATLAEGMPQVPAAAQILAQKLADHAENTGQDLAHLLTLDLNEMLKQLLATAQPQATSAQEPEAAPERAPDEQPEPQAPADQPSEKGTTSVPRGPRKWQAKPYKRRHHERTRRAQRPNTRGKGQGQITFRQAGRPCQGNRKRAALGARSGEGGRPPPLIRDRVYTRARLYRGRAHTTKTNTTILRASVQNYVRKSNTNRRLPLHLFGGHRRRICRTCQRCGPKSHRSPGHRPR